MILDLSSGTFAGATSRYPHARLALAGKEAFILGADPATASEVERYLKSATSIDAASARQLLHDVPGIYCVVVRAARETIVITDPYAIVKLYLARTKGRVVLVDDVYELEGESFSLDTDALQYFFLRGYTPSRHTFFREVAKLDPCTLHRFDGVELRRAEVYADLEGPGLTGRGLVPHVRQLLAADIDRFYDRFPGATLCLTGGIDSSVLHRLIQSGGYGQRTNLVVEQLDGLGQTRPIDVDYDVAHARRLAAEDGRALEVFHYDFSREDLPADFKWLRRALFTEFAPAFGFAALARALPPDRVVISGQNADSILSFGSMGWPRIERGGIRGLNGLFSRYFCFYGSHPRLTPLYGVASLLRAAYHLRQPAAPRDSSEDALLVGLGVHPENRFFDPADPAVGSIASPEAVRDWFLREYVAPARRAHPRLSVHGLATLLYTQTYMQGAANRASVLSSMLQGRHTFLPYTGIGLLEAMCRVKPDWRLAYYGKYANVALAKGDLRLPSYIIKRSDPNDSDSTDLIYKQIMGHPGFGTLVKSAVTGARLARYDGILHPRILDRLARLQRDWTPENPGLQLRLTWLESTFADFSLSS